MAFDEAAVNTLMTNVTDHASRLGVFRSVNKHEPKGAPGSGMRYSVWVQTIEPLGAASGLAETSGYVVLWGRIFGNAFMKPEDELDPQMLTAATTLLAAYSGDFNFGDTVRNVDLLGTFGQKMGAQAGYVTIQQTMYRVMTITIPVIINDMWTQVA
jgi:hypothetical protein